MSKREQSDLIVESLNELFEDDEILEKQLEDKSQAGRVGVRVIRDDGTEKNNIKYLRVPEMGSVECFKLESGEWAVTRRDNLEHNKQDKLNNDGGES